jgi:hypothetical protein
VKWIIRGRKALGFCRNGQKIIFGRYSKIWNEQLGARKSRIGYPVTVLMMPKIRGIAFLNYLNAGEW